MYIFGFYFILYYLFLVLRFEQTNETMMTFHELLTKKINMSEYTAFYLLKYFNIWSLDHAIPNIVTMFT